MQSTLSPKATDDPCDDVMIAPDVVQVVPSDEELSDLLQQAARHRLAHTAPDVTVDPPARPIDAMPSPTSANDERGSDQRTARSTAPVVDVMFRPAAPANDDRGSGVRRSLVRQATRALIALLLAVGIGLTAVAWKSYGAAATKMITKLVTQVVIGSTEPEQSAQATQSAPPAVRAETANAASGQPAPTAPTAPTSDAIAPAAPASLDSTQLLQSMTRDLATLGQEVEELKAGMEQLKASQQQMLRDIARTSEQNLRPKPSATPPRSAAAQTRKPTYSYAPPQTAAAPPAMPRVAAPYYVPPQPEPVPQAAAEPPIDAESSVPRPPMPVR